MSYRLVHSIACADTLLLVSTEDNHQCSHLIYSCMPEMATVIQECDPKYIVPYSP